MKRTLKEIGLFWRNDKPGGLGLRVMDGDLDSASTKILDVAEKELREVDHQELRESCTTQLSDFAKMPLSERPENLWVLVLGNLHILTTLGDIRQDDEYNGILYQYALTGSRK